VHALWRGDRLWLRAALGHPGKPLSALLRTEVDDAVSSDSQARALGERAAQALQAQGSAAYLADS
jgi:hypothetical protein